MAEKRVRPSPIAGSWYPERYEELTALIDGLLHPVQTTLSQHPPFGFIVPHAGYVYSGATAARAYGLLEKQKIKRVVILAPMHHWGNGRYFIPHFTHFQTPLGEVQIDQDALDRLGAAIAFTPLEYDAEHAIEIQLPFLQRVLDDFKLLPLMIGTHDLNDIDQLVEALLTLDDIETTLWIASSDLHHESSYEVVVEKDTAVIDALHTSDIDRILSTMTESACTVCGRFAILTLLKLARRAGHPNIEILHHTNSGEVTGEKTPGQYTVGYVSAMIY